MYASINTACKHSCQPMVTMDVLPDIGLVESFKLSNHRFSFAGKEEMQIEGNSKDLLSKGIFGTTCALIEQVR